MAKISKIIYLVLISLFVILLYTFIHESGHALAVILQGGTVLTFDINYLFSHPHISYTGLTTDSSRALVSISGLLFPYLIFVILIPFIHRIRAVLIKLVAVLFSIGVLGSLIPNIFLPILHIFGVSPQGEDIINFINHSSIEPLAISLIFILTTCVSLIYLIKVGKIRNVYSDILNSNELIQIQSLNIRKRVVFVMLLILLVIPLIHRSLNLQSANLYEDSDVIIETTLDNLEDDIVTIRTFEVIETQVFDFIYNIKTDEDLKIYINSLSGPGFLYTHNDRITIFDGEEDVSQGYFTNIILEPGAYCINIEQDTRQNNGNVKFGITQKYLSEDDYFYYDILSKIKNKTFIDSYYQQEGFNLIYNNHEIKGSFEEKIPVNISSNRISISVFAVGDFEEFLISFRHHNGHVDLLKNSFATIGLSLDVRVNDQGEFIISTMNADDLSIYIYVKEIK
jgi:hypothetical protein